MYCSTSLLVTIWAGSALVYSQTPLRCFDCNSGSKGFGPAICPPNGNLKRELLTTVRCSERCFSRTIADRPGVVRRGCSAGIGFFLSRPLPKDGCVQVSSKNWWCFCSDSLCNVDDMTSYGEGTAGLLPLEEDKMGSEEEPMELWPRQKTKPTTGRPTRPTRPTRPQSRAKPRIPKQPREQDTQSPRVRDNFSLEEPQAEVESVEQPTEFEEDLEEPSYEEQLDTWEERPYLEPEENFPDKEEKSYTEGPFDSHYTRHTHHNYEDDEQQQRGENEEPSNQKPLALP